MKWLEINKELKDIEEGLEYAVDTYYCDSSDDIMKKIIDLVKRVAEEGDK